MVRGHASVPWPEPHQVAWPSNLELQPPPQRTREHVFPDPTFPLIPEEPEAPEGGDHDSEEWAGAPGGQ